MEQIASDEVLEQAFEWLCKRREKYSENSDVWNIRRKWRDIKIQLQADLLAGRYRFTPLEQIRLNGENIELWTSLDALVLKATAIVLNQRLKPIFSKHCCHITGNGGAKGAVRSVYENQDKNRFVFRTDVKSYYANINHKILYEQLRRHIKDQRVLDLLKGYIERTVYYGGTWRDVKCGISLGCPLSPIMGALYLKELDDRMAETGLFYRRFMDDWVILAPTRWKLRSAIKIVNQILNDLKVEQHPDKTFIGRISRGFDFLGYSFKPSQLKLAEKTLQNFVERITRLYEQDADLDRIGQYVRHFIKWSKAGVSLNFINDLSFYLPL